MSDNKIRVGITHGDTNGIGYETILKMFEDPRMAEMCTITLFGSAKAAGAYRKILEMPSQPHLNRVDSAANAQENVYNVVNVIGEDLKIEPGTASKEAGQAAFAALEKAVEALRNGDIDVLVTAPINKHNIQSDLFQFPGHTEYLESTLGNSEKHDKALMILCAEDLRIALQTIHTPIAKVAESITKEGIVERLEQFDRSLRRDFGVQHPRIAVLALNPHAGEQGMLGSEEQEIIAPAIAEARDKRIMAFGPYAADGFFGNRQYEAFDGVLAMYHDQGLAPFKALAMEHGVNFTAGLPYVRTSPDHGTGYDIAGKGLANPQSLRDAVYTAIDIFRKRENYDEAYRRPLQRSTK